MSDLTSKYTIITQVSSENHSQSNDPAFINDGIKSDHNENYAEKHTSKNQQTEQYKITDFVVLEYHSYIEAKKNDKGIL